MVRIFRMFILLTTFVLIGLIITSISAVEGISGKMWFSVRRINAARKEALNRYKTIDKHVETTTSTSKHFDSDSDICFTKKKSNHDVFNNSNSVTKHSSATDFRIIYYNMFFALYHLASRLSSS